MDCGSAKPDVQVVAAATGDKHSMRAASNIPAALQRISLQRTGHEQLGPTENGLA